MKIIADTATLFSPDEGRDMGITVIPVCVAINDRTYKDYEEISSEEFLRLISEGGVPTSSQPSVGDVLEVLENCSEETLFLTVGDGLSGAYQTAIGAKNCIENNGHIHIIDSQTLAGPMRYLAKKAVALKQQGISLQEIKASLLHSIETSVSFVIPEDFEFLKRSGRLTAITAKVGGVLKLMPVLTQTEDRKRIKPLAIKRSWRAAVDTIIQRMQTIGINNNYLISVCHAGTYQKAADVLKQIKESFPCADSEILPLSPALITHGGPGCIVVQAIEK
ncbi:MAG: DegV family protein [Oscillospiraceae bacterium]|nr:DegV family protein [Oscillospiraceae bacterium]